MSRSPLSPLQKKLSKHGVVRTRVVRCKLETACPLGLRGRGCVSQGSARSWGPPALGPAPCAVRRRHLPFGCRPPHNRVLVLQADQQLLWRKTGRQVVSSGVTASPPASPLHLAESAPQGHGVGKLKAVTRKESSLLSASTEGRLKPTSAAAPGQQIHPAQQHRQKAGGPKSTAASARWGRLPRRQKRSHTWTGSWG